MKELEFTIEKMTSDDVEAVTKMRLQSWLDTYVNDDAGVSREWIEARNKRQMSPEAIARRKDFLKSPHAAGFVAKDNNRRIIGAASPYLDEDNIQHVGSLYVDKDWHGKGVGGQLMERIIEWSDPTLPIELGVVSYNERAKAFYRKWGFEEVSGAETLFDNKIPEVKMIRKGDKQ